MAEQEFRPGSREDFDRLYREVYPRLLRTVWAILGDGAAAEDCVQEAFVRAYQAWPRYRPDRPAQAWVHQIAINVAISYRRKLKLRQVGELLRRLGRPAPERDPAEQALAGDVVAAVGRLPASLSVPFLLRHYHGYSTAEIARLTHTPERTVRLRLSQARARLRGALGEGWNRSLPKPRSSNVSLACTDTAGDG